MGRVSLMGRVLRATALVVLLLVLAQPAAGDSYAIYPGVFSIDMQGTPEGFNPARGVHGFVASSGGLEFQAIFYDVGSSGDDMQQVEAARRGMMQKSNGGQITSVNTLPGVGDAAEEFTLKLDNGAAVRTRIIKIGPRLFGLTVTNPAGDDLPVVWHLFFGSFRAM